jgi:2-dehydropantoate 2-reductase
MAAEHRILVYGAGAVGGYLGGKLAATGEADVTLLGRPRVVSAVSQHGLLIRDEGGRYVFSRPRAVERIAEGDRVDAVLLSVRTYDVPSALPDLARLAGEGSLVLAFQNGVGSEEVLAGALGRDRVLPCTLTVSAGMEEPGVITRYSRSGGVALSTMNARPVPPWIVGLFEATDLPVALIPDYRSLRWSKLLLNMLAAPTSAILDMDIGPLLRDPATFDLERRAFLEAAAVMDAAGIGAAELPGYPVPMARRVMQLPAPLARLTLGRRIASARGGRSPGMRADMQRGRSEIADFNGAVARAGERLGVPTPVNRALTALTEDLAAHPGHRESFRGNPKGLVAWIQTQTPSAASVRNSGC